MIKKLSLAILVLGAALTLVHASGYVMVMDPVTKQSMQLKGGDGIDINAMTKVIKATGVPAAIFDPYTSAGGGRATNDRADFLQGQINTQTSDSRFPTTDEKAAMTAATAPSTDNPFATRADLAFVNYSATSVTVTAGGTATGSVTDTRSANDTLFYQVQEAAGVPGFDVRFTFSGAGHFNQVATRFQYNGSTTHDVYMQLYNYGTLQWDNLHPTPIHGTTSYAWVSFAVPDETAYVSGGAPQVRFYHTTTGSTAHVLYIDYIVLQHSTMGGATTLHSQLVGRSGADQHPTSAIAGLDTTLAGKEPADSTIIKESELSSSTTSTATNVAANSAAVKTAYDLAAGKLSPDSDIAATKITMPATSAESYFLTGSTMQTHDLGGWGLSPQARSISVTKSVTGTHNGVIHIGTGLEYRPSGSGVVGLNDGTPSYLSMDVGLSVGAEKQNWGRSTAPLPSEGEVNGLYIVQRNGGKQSDGAGILVDAATNDLGDGVSVGQKHNFNAILEGVSQLFSGASLVKKQNVQFGIYNKLQHDGIGMALKAIQGVQGPAIRLQSTDINNRWAEGLYLTGNFTHGVNTYGSTLSGDALVMHPAQTIGDGTNHYTLAQLAAAGASDAVYSTSWNGDTTTPPSKNAVYDKIEAILLTAGTGDVIGPISATNNAIALFDGTSGKTIKDSAKTIVTSLGSDDTTLPTSKAVKDVTDLKATTVSPSFVGLSAISSGTVTMTTSALSTAMTTSATITLQAGDYVVPTTNTTGIVYVLVGGTGTAFTLARDPASVTTAETFNIYRRVNTTKTNGGVEAFSVQGGTGYVGIGTPAPTVALHVVNPASFVEASIEGYSQFGANVNMRSARGTQTAPLVVQSGDRLASFFANGYDGSIFRTAAALLMESDGTPGLLDMPGRMTFWTTPDGSATRAERMRITSTGAVCIGNTTCTGAGALTVTGNATAKTFTGTIPAATTYGATTTVDLSLGDSPKVTLTGATTLAFSNPIAGQWHKFHIKQDATGNRAVTWPATGLVCTWLDTSNLETTTAPAINLAANAVTEIIIHTTSATTAECYKR